MLRVRFHARMLRCSAPLLRYHVEGVPLPCCVCSVLLIRCQAVWSPPLLTACVCDLCRVRVLVRLNQPRPPDRKQHGCTVGVLPGPTRVLPMPKQYGIGRRAPNRVVVWIVSSFRFVMCPLAHLLDMVTAAALSILGDTSHHSWLISPSSSSTCSIARLGSFVLTSVSISWCFESWFILSC